MFTISLKQIHEEGTRGDRWRGGRRGRREEEGVEVNIYADSAGVIRNVVNLTNVDFILKTTTTANYTFWNYSTALFQQTVLHMYPFFFLPPPFLLFMDISVFSNKSLM